MLTTNQIREQFLQYFEKNGHRRVSSSSLVPAGDPTLLFTNAGMNQFKDVFLGREPRDYNRATTSQKCVRAGGKHNDLENVGRTARHHTFFEMLGNFSFGDYFKEGAIKLAWELIVDQWGLEVDRLWFTVFEGGDGVPADEEAAALWVKAGASPDRVLRFGKKDNFWSMGDTGPCGPCSEMHYFRGEDMSKNVAALVNGEGDDTMEIWNLVFMQYDRGSDGVLVPLPAPSVDTGLGLERIASVLQKTTTNYDIDLFKPIIEAIERESGYKYGGQMDDELDTAVRVLCDHARAATFLINDRVRPSKEGRGYVLRKIIRRALSFGRRFDVRRGHRDGTFILLQDLVPAVVKAMKEPYPELLENQSWIMKVLAQEESQFTYTREATADLIREAVLKAATSGESRLSGDVIFKLRDTHGAELELIEEIADEEGIALDREGFDVMMTAARAKARASSKFQSSTDAATFAKVAEKAGSIEFVGYDQYIDVPSTVKAIVIAGKEQEAIHHGSEGEVVISPTPFYAESGGQIGDAGSLEWDGGRASVLDTQKPVGDLVVSRVRVDEGHLSVNMNVRASVPILTRLDTTANHTATHLLHKALKDVLGETVQQAGSLVAPDRLRFDYTYHQALSEAQQRRVEEIVNDKIRENLDVTKTVMPIAEAKKTGAVAMFGEKYGENVRIVTAGDFSREFCGGCHVNRTGDIGLFKITNDRSLAAGVRRMEALTGRGALAYFQTIEDAAHELQQQLNVRLEDVPAQLRTMQERQKAVEKELKQLKLKVAGGGTTASSSSSDDSVDIEGVKLVARRIDDVSGGDLRNLADTFRSKLHSGVVVLGSVTDGKVTLLTAVTKDLLARVNANALINKLAPIVGGKGGGKPDLAQAGGKDPEKLNEAIEHAPQALREVLGADGVRP